MTKCVTMNHISIILTPAQTIFFGKHNPDSVKHLNPISITGL